MTSGKKVNHWVRVLLPLMGLLFFSVLVLFERRGIQLDPVTTMTDLDDLWFTEQENIAPDTLLYIDEQDTNAMKLVDEVRQVLKDMRISYVEKDVNKVPLSEILQDYRIVIIGFEDWDKFTDSAETFAEWLRDGGKMMNICTPGAGNILKLLARQLGINNLAEYVGIRGVKVQHGSMIGAAYRDEYPFTLEEGEELLISLGISLDEKSRIYLTDLDGKTPLLWSADVGSQGGRVAMINFTMVDKFMRSFYCLAYSLLDEVSVYPVINGSVYYLDDFPSPVPGGDSSFIQRDYGVDTATFYSSIWWPQIYSWEKKFGIIHTGLIIETYADEVKAPFEKNRTTDRFLNFGTMILNNRGELGYHGYNHQPLALKGQEEDWQFGSYHLWSSMEDMAAALKELKSFCSGLFPGQKFTVYVPPSNIMSPIGKTVLAQAVPNIRVLASTYLQSTGLLSYVTEFEEDEMGFVNTPRITSGCDIDDYQYLTAFSELNYHFAQSHFMHPDDVLDPDRGAQEGWAAMAKQFTGYLEYIRHASSDLRNVTGSQMGSATLQYDRLRVDRRYEEEGKLKLGLSGFSGEAYLLLRVNTPQEAIPQVEGGTLSKEANGLFLLHATASDVVISW